jgi:hypothetical protein
MNVRGLLSAAAAAVGATMLAGAWVALSQTSSSAAVLADQGDGHHPPTVTITLPGLTRTATATVTHTEHETATQTVDQTVIQAPTGTAVPSPTVVPASTLVRTVTETPPGEQPLPVVHTFSVPAHTLPATAIAVAVPASDADDPPSGSANAEIAVIVGFAGLAAAGAGVAAWKVRAGRH